MILFQKVCLKLAQKPDCMSALTASDTLYEIHSLEQL